MSNSEPWQALRELFHRALDLPAAERRAFLVAECHDQPELAHQLLALLEAHEEAGEFLEGGLAEAEPELLAPWQTATQGLRIGAYRVVEELGRGGMGAVYLAERADDSFHQRVALKLVKRGMDSEEILRRFLAERQILATLNHPHIARLLDGGSDSEGRPFFVMEHIEGTPITAYCASRGEQQEGHHRDQQHPGDGD
ncbi:MAG TPA: protein kinase, partial [Thermoanaerobaculia bacterium]|nr:protein kinase [Thermoanaerobaculia bacterium]